MHVIFVTVIFQYHWFIWLRMLSAIKFFQVSSSSPSYSEKLSLPLAALIAFFRDSESYCHYELNYVFPKKLYVEVRTPSTCTCDLIWK